VFSNAKVQEVLKEISNNQMSVVMQVFGGSHLALFLPIVYFQVETVNVVLVEEFDGTKLQDLSF
jgi:Mor family transcriptional regulator